MGMSVGAGKGGGGRRRRGVPRYSAMAEINMTPFIDVMLVLLIIFMVAAPMLVSGIPIDLPQTKAAALNNNSAKTVIVAIDEKGAVFVNDQPVEPEALPNRLQSVAKEGFDEPIYVKGSKVVPYGRVAETLSIMTTAGYKKTILVTEQERK